MKKLDPVMQSVSDFYYQPFMLLMDLAVVEAAQRKGIPVEYVPEVEKCTRFAKEVEKWVEKNIR